MQDLAVDILSPGLNPEHLDQDQQSTIHLAKVIEDQQKALIAAKKKVQAAGGDPSTVVAVQLKLSSNVPTPTIIIEQVSKDAPEPSPIQPTKKFKRSKAPPPLRISDASVGPSIQTAPIRNGQAAFQGSKADFVQQLRAFSSRIAARRVAQSPAAAYFAPRYYPSIAPLPGLAPGMLNPYYRQMLMMRGSALSTPRNAAFAGIPGAPVAPINPTPTSALAPGGPVTPLHQGFQPRQFTTALENYVINGKEALAIQTAHKRVGKTEGKPSELRKALALPVELNIVKQTILTGLKKLGGPKTPIHLQKSNTPHVTDVFPGEMTKFAPVSNQPLSARDEHFDFNLYKEEKDKDRSVNDIQEVDEDVESNAIEENSKMNVELETATVELPTDDIEEYKDYKIDLRIRTDFGHKVTKIRFAKDTKSKKESGGEKKQFMKACEAMWEEFVKKKGAVAE